MRTSSELVKQIRHDAIYEILDADDAQVILEEFENELVDANLKLSEQIRYYTNPQKYESFLGQFSGLLDATSKKFLGSAAKVSAFANKHQPDDFDFSLPASGLWKTVEREINASVIWLLRYKNGIAGADSPWIVTPNGLQIELPAKSLRKIRTVEKDAPNELKSVMLGWARSYIAKGYENGLSNELLSIRNSEPFQDPNTNLTSFALGSYDKRQADTTSLLFLIEQVQFFRNHHAHIQAMSRKTFAVFEDLLFEPSNSPRASLLGKLLIVKENIRKHIQNVL